MTHFRGLPTDDFADWRPLCSTRAAPTTGPVTQSLGRVDCPECRKILKLGAREMNPGRRGYTTNGDH